MSILLLALLRPNITWAHVKWFCTYDVTQPTKPLLQVIDRNFVYTLAPFLALFFLGFCLDGWAANRWPALESWRALSQRGEEKIIRAGIQAFFFCTWTIGLNIITPELHTQSSWVFGVQFVIALAALWRRSCVISAIGMAILWMDGIYHYGFFHMVDYLYFLGYAFYLACTSFDIAKLLNVRIPVMTGCLAFSLMWTAIEKLLYPQWSQQLMAKHGHMMMGMRFEVFIVVAAFVEFTLAFYLATGRGLLRLGAMALLIVFISAMPEFGPRDVVGHFPLVAMLAIPLLTGDSLLQRSWRLMQSGVAVNALVTCALYIFSLAGFLCLYHGVQWMEYHR